MNYRMIKYTLGWLLMFESAFLLIPSLTALICTEWKSLFSFLISACICLAIGALCILNKPKKTTLYAKDGLVIAALTWITLSIFGAIPFLLTGVISNPVDALFETISGFTTTGSTIFTAVAHLPRSILIWRSFTHWVGGMGVLVFVMAFLPLAGGQNMHIMKAESPGPEVSKFVPKVRKTALILYGIYFVLTLSCFIAYWISGFSFFESICNAFSTAGTGGFGIRNDSFASVTPAQQWIAIVFMFLFAINFNSYYFILRRKFKDAFNAEVRTFILIVLSAITIITVNINLNRAAIGQFDNIADEIRHSAFYVTALISTTGFATVDFNFWPALAQMILMLILFIGACAGSTGGGFKVSRVLILLKGMKNEIGKSTHPRQVKRITIDKRPVDGEVIKNVNAFLVAYVFVFVMSAAVVCVEPKNDIVSGVTAVMTALSNVGPGLGSVGPVNNFAHLSNLSKLVLSFDMLAGRLEIFPMLILFNPTTWKKR